jgi:putative membrane protein
MLVLHIFGVIFWLGGLLMVTSMLGHAASEIGSARERIILVARRLFRTACNAGLVITLIFGFAVLAFEPELMAQGWLHAKLLLALVLVVVHIWIGRRINASADAPESMSRGQFMMLHGLVSIILLGILVLVVVKPF